ncbi:2-keto-4-pentenoate hydratase [Paenibacillus sp. J23TS9]|uniref:2-keto-4-pentenoate hydratase n=1 Tax=Paenibacillus sp. J23TS9 TaxID=2807193 RepID=UPI001B261060|nr:fumarylacetoacetate hydrolase family protein [Paenibacillus sp. J23TS9]GIP29352.1 2-keto-4-pentenoate hydratase [Paenibacillus sp. J23TS9]
MAITQAMQQDIVNYLLDAEQERKEVLKLTENYPELSLNTAYDVQTLLIRRKIEAGTRSIGYKLGLTSKAKQEMMGVYEAIYGVLTRDMLALEWEPMDHKQFIHPKAEPEIAFFIGEDLQGTDITGEDVLRATQYVAAAIEVIDSRYLDFKFTLPDVVADNCSSAKFVIGSKMVPVRDVELPELGVVMTKNSQVVTTGSGAAVLGDPAVSVAWAVNKLGERGLGLRRGDVVLSGAITEAIAFKPGDTIQAQFAHLGSVTLSCV